MICLIVEFSESLGFSIGIFIHLNLSRIDATSPSSGVGRFFNDSAMDANMRVVKNIHHGKPLPIFVTKRDIKVGEELTYNYGGRSSSYPWRKKGM